jgi:hypothetical protein
MKLPRKREIIIKMQRRARSTPLKVADLSMSAAQIHFIG